jgi:hypothetical protein
MNEIEKDEELKNQLVGWGVALPTILLAFFAGAGALSLLFGAVAAVGVLTWRIKKMGTNGGAK